MESPTRYPQELRERAVRMLLEHGGEYPSEWAALGSISAKLGMTRETLRRWVRRAQVDGGVRSGVTTAERERIRELERENRELRRPFEWAVLPTGRSYFVAVTVRTRTSARFVTPLRLCDLIE